MADSSEIIKFVSVEQVKGTLVISFSDGSTAVYHPEFLHSVRDHDGNVELEKPRDPGSFRTKF